MHHRYRNLLLSSLLLAGLLAAVPFAPPQAQSKQQAVRAALQRRAAAPGLEGGDAFTGNFVIVATPDGKKECRPLTAREELEMGFDQPRGELRVLGDNNPQRTQQTGLKITLRGDNIVPEFIAMLESYVESHYGEAVSVR